jgi:4'-phosphopantetheinyl transferase
VIRWAVDSLDRHPGLSRGEPSSGLLTSRESATLAGLTVPKRRRDWLIGRHTLKALLVEHLRENGRPVRPSDVEVRPAPSGAPEVFAGGRQLDCQVSITHSEGRAASAVSPNPSVAVGIDLETVAPRPSRFVADHFTNDEAEHVRRAPPGERDRLITTIWGGKEAVLKALRLGLTVSPRLVTCRPGSLLDSAGDWVPMQVAAAPEVLVRAGMSGDSTVLRGWWRPLDGQVLTLVTCAGAPSRSTS